MPFGIKSAPEVFQRIMDEMLEGISGAYATMDNILVAGRDDEHHDKTQKQVINRATTYNLELNTETLHFRKSSVPYLGHLTSERLIADPEKGKAI